MVFDTKMFRSGANPQSHTCPPMPENPISPTWSGKKWAEQCHIWATVPPNTNTKQCVTCYTVHPLTRHLHMYTRGTSCFVTMQHAVKEMIWDA